MSFGTELRRWRTQRGRAQLELATLAGYSQRHISFLESGKAQPSRHTVVALAEALEVPIGERNALLKAAGFAPLFSAEPVDSQTIQFAVEALDEVLNQHRPFPAIVVDRAWNMYAGNMNALALFNRFMVEPQVPNADTPLNVLQLTLSPRGTRPFIKNWAEFASVMLLQLKKELDFDRNQDALEALIRAFEGDKELARYRRQSDPQMLKPVSTIVFERDDARFELMTFVSHFLSTSDETLANLRIETFFPADDATRSALMAIDQEIPQVEDGTNLWWGR